MQWGNRNDWFYRNVQQENLALSRCKESFVVASCPWAELSSWLSNGWWECGQVKNIVGWCTVGAEGVSAGCADCTGVAGLQGAGGSMEKGDGWQLRATRCHSPTDCDQAFVTGMTLKWNQSAWCVMRFSLKHQDFLWCMLNRTDEIGLLWIIRAMHKASRCQVFLHSILFLFEGKKVIREHQALLPGFKVASIQPQGGSQQKTRCSHKDLSGQIWLLRIIQIHDGNLSWCLGFKVFVWMPPFFQKRWREAFQCIC